MLADDTDIQFAGGAELQQVILARGLAQRGYPVSMICMDFGQDELVEIDRISVHRAWRSGSGLPVLRFIWPRLTSIWRCLKRADADIYCHRSASMLTGVMAYFARRHRKKSVFAVAGKNKIRIGRDRRLFDYGLRHVDCIVVQNLAQQREIREIAGRESYLIPNCYDASPSSKMTSGRNVLWVGTIRHVKRPDIFLDLAESFPALDFTMIGGPSEQEMELFTTTRERADAMPNVTFEGFVPYAKVDPFFDKATLFVNTSDSEGFPNTFLQSWARGIPTISFVDTGARRDGEPIDCVVESFSHMATRVSELIENEQERQRLGDACKLYIAETHSLQVVLDLYEHVFAKLCPERFQATHRI